MIRSLVLSCFALSCIGAQAVTVHITKYTDAACGNAVGYLFGQADGGTPPYTYAWNTGATTPEVGSLLPGEYSLTVTDALGAQATDTETILSTMGYPSLGLSDTPPSVSCPGEPPYALVFLDGRPICGPSPHMITNPDIVAQVNIPGFEHPYSYVWFDEAPGSIKTITWTDANGCPGTSDLYLSIDLVAPELQSLTVTPACNGNNGSIHSTFNMPVAESVLFRLGRMDGSILPNDQDAYNQGLFSCSWNGLAPGAYWLLVDPDLNDDVGPDRLVCIDSFYVEVPDLSGSCGHVSGTAYYDREQDCVKATNDPGIRHRVVTFEPGPHYAITNSNGRYDAYLGNGTYTATLDGTGTDHFPICPSTPGVEVVVNGGNVLQDFADSSLAELDIIAFVSIGPARPGFLQNIWIGAREQAARTSGPLDLVLEIDPQFTFASADIAPTSVAGNTLTWSGLAGIEGPGSRGVHVLVQVPADVGLIGQPFTHTVSVSQPVAEPDLTNNTDSRTGTITGSFDPNEKTVRTSSGSTDGNYYIGHDEWMEYTIGFQNTGTDTAFTVVLRDTLSDALDLATFRQGVASHPFTVTFWPNRVVEWRFANIQLPDSNTNEPMSHGQVEFRIQPKQPVVPGMVLTNVADIYFDFNPPIRTNDAVLVAESTTGVRNDQPVALGLAPNPADDHVRISGPFVAGTRYAIMGADGRCAASGTLAADGRITIASLAAGLYAVQLSGVAPLPGLRFIKR